MDVGKADLTGEENFNPNPKYWDYHRGDWKIERHRGCDPFPAEARFARYNCVTSYSSCLRHQKIDLSKWYPNIANLITNGFKVRVYWTVWIAARYDCHSKYRAFILYGAGGRKSDENKLMKFRVVWWILVKRVRTHVLFLLGAKKCWGNL